VIKDMSKILQMRSEITEDKVPVSFQELVDTKDQDGTTKGKDHDLIQRQWNRY
jgi:hypothetical protein